MAGPVRIGFLYPGTLVDDDVELHQAEDDYPLAQQLISPPVDFVLAKTRMEDAHREDALRRTGSTEYLLEGARRLREEGVSAAMWACTSGSFVFGLDGARAQARSVANHLGVPTSSTSLAFVEACRHIGAGRVAIAASYPPEIVRLFVSFLEDAGLDVVGSESADIMTGVEVGTLDRDHLVELIARTDQPCVEALLVPDTAWHTIGLLQELDATLGKPVLTANQVTIWQGLLLAGRRERQQKLGALFA